VSASHTQMPIDHSHPKPDFFIVGAPKCGTTSMAEYLNRHPEVFVIRGEPHFFGSDIDYNTPRMPRARYQALWQSAGDKRLIGDRSTWYLYSERAAAEIHAYNPDARVIAMLRHPAELIHSLHAHHAQRDRRDDIADLAEALAAEPERRQGRRIPPNARFAATLWYSRIPRYSAQLTRYFKAFGREQVLVILFDDLKSDPAGVYREVLEFLGADPDFKPDFSVHNAAAPATDSWLRRLWKTGTWRYRVRALLPQALYSRLRRRRGARMARAAARAPRAALDPALRARLIETFLPEVEALEKLLKRDLSAWRQ